MNTQLLPIDPFCRPFEGTGELTGEQADRLAMQATLTGLTGFGLAAVVAVTIGGLLLASELEEGHKRKYRERMASGKDGKDW
jgi:hypothetical protein